MTIYDNGTAIGTTTVGARTGTWKYVLGKLAAGAYSITATATNAAHQTSVPSAPLNFTVDLSKLAPGKYDCQVTVLDPMGAKGAFWQAPILLVP